jgi:NAD+ synthase (glutamine-hydrolysing)
MKVALAQINPIIGDLEGNTKKIISIIKKTHADMIVFPELAISGYCPQDLLMNSNFIRQNDRFLKKIVDSLHNKIAAIGFVNKIAGNLYNAAAVIQNKKIMCIHHKIRLPNYDVFDDKRWFKNGEEATTFQIKGRKIGVNICEDLWSCEVTKKQKLAGAEFIINLSASPYRAKKIKALENILKKRWKENKIPIIYVNQVGGQDGLVYFGHSMYFKDGRIVKRCKDFMADLIIVDV